MIAVAEAMVRRFELFSRLFHECGPRVVFAKTFGTVEKGRSQDANRNVVLEVGTSEQTPV